MAAKITGMVWDIELTPPKQIVLLAMADHANHDGENIFPSIPLLAWKTGYSQSQVRRIIHDLIEDGILTYERRPGTSNMYQIHLDKGTPKPPFVRPDVSQNGRGKAKRTPVIMEGDTPSKVTGVSDGSTPSILPSTPTMPEAKKPQEPPLEPPKDKDKEKESSPKNGDGSVVLKSPKPTPSKQESTPPTDSPVTPPETNGWAAAVAATREALAFGNAAYDLVGRYTSFLMGRIEPEQTTKRGIVQDNGEWFTMQPQPGLTALEIKAFGLYMETMHRDLMALRKPMAMADYVGRFKGDKLNYTRFMIHASSPEPEPEKAWTPPEGAEDHKAEVDAAMKLITDKFRGKAS